jgi:hypothetical protein
MERPADAIKETFLGTLNSNEYVQIDSLKQATEYGVKDLNLKNTYADDKPTSVKEHLQNWRDRW